MNPADPQLPADLIAGPYGFLVVIAFCLFWGLREWRKGREVDIAGHRRRAEEAERRADTAEAAKDALEDKQARDTSVLVTKIEGLQSEIQSLREAHYRELERVMSKYYSARQKLIEQGVPAEDIP